VGGSDRSWNDRVFQPYPWPSLWIYPLHSSHLCDQ
jgi:hypothetical protein